MGPPPWPRHIIRVRLLAGVEENGANFFACASSMERFSGHWYLLAQKTSSH